MFLVLALSTVASAAQPQIVASFDASALETPESMAFDTHGNLYLSMALTGEIRRIDSNGTQSTVAMMPIGAPLTTCGSFIGIQGALTIDPSGDLYVTVASCDPDSRGVWTVDSDTGDAWMVASLPEEALPNGIAWRDDRLHVADSELGRIWTMPADGSGPAEVWSDDILLKPSVGHVFPGPNGIQFFHDELYVANSDQMTILAIPVEADGSAGEVRVHATDAPCDDFSFDIHGNLYGTTDPFNTVIEVTTDGEVSVLLSAANGIDGPSATVFGRTGTDRKALYITNAAFPFFSTTHQPSLMRYELGVTGAPRY